MDLTFKIYVHKIIHFDFFIRLKVVNEMRLKETVKYWGLNSATFFPFDKKETLLSTL